MKRLFEFLRMMIGGMCLSVAALQGGPAVAQSELPVTASASYLATVGKDGTWLDEQMEQAGVAAGFARDGQQVTLSTPDARRVFHRIRAFAAMSQGARPAPYVRLVLDDGSGNLQSCITNFAGTLLPSVSVDDYARVSFDASELDPKARSILQCLPANQAQSAALPLEFKLAFDAKGMLRAEYRDLQEDQTFLHALWNAGVYMVPESFSGMLTIE